MAVNIELKRSAVPGKVPTTGSLNLGEIAINTYDGKVYFKKDNGTASIVELTALTSGSVPPTASYAISASYALTASYAVTSTSASYALSASYSFNATSASYALTASSADNFIVRGTLTAQTIVAQTITSSTEFITGSTKFGTQLTDTHQFTGSVSVTGSLAVNGSNVILTNQTSSMSVATASYVLNAVSSSFASTASFVANAQTSSYALQALSASFALTASYVANASSFPFTGSAIITGSLVVTGSVSSTGGFTGSLLGTASFANNATSASNALTASYVLNAVSSSFATSASNATTASYVLNAVSSSFASTASYINPLNQLVIITGSLIQGLEGNIATGDYSHAEGSITKAIGNYSHAEGDFTQAKGDYSHAEGQETIASGSYSHTEGYQTIALADHQHVQGQFNATSSVPAAFIVGNGTDDSNRSNLIYAAGNEVQISGSVKVFGSITGSLFGTASWAQNAVTASYVAAANVAGLSLFQITTGSITASVGIGLNDLFLIKSGSVQYFNISSSGNTTISSDLFIIKNFTTQQPVVTVSQSIVQFATQSTSPTGIAPNGGFWFTSTDFYVGLN